MKASLKRKWLEALRSDKYLQTGGMLKCSYTPTEGKPYTAYCCLGVLCDVMDDTRWEKDVQGSTIYYFYDRADINSCFENSATSLPFSVATELGLSAQKRIEMLNPDGTFSHEEEKSIADALMHFNDNREWTFDQIADWIEDEVPEEDDSIEEAMHQEDC